MEQLNENIEEISKKFGIVIFIVIILVFIYNHKSSVSPLTSASPPAYKSLFPDIPFNLSSLF